MKMYWKKVWAAVLVLAMFLAQMQVDLTSQAAGKARLNKKKVTVQVGGKVRLKLKGARGKVVWKSKHKKIATVNAQGVVTGKKAGKTVVTAKNKKKTYKCTVTVKAGKPTPEPEDSDEPEETEEPDPADVVTNAPVQSTNPSAAPTQSVKPTTVPTGIPYQTANPGVTTQPAQPTPDDTSDTPETTSPAVTEPVQTAKPTAAPTVKPTAKPTMAPTAKPTAAPTVKPTAAPTVKPTAKPTAAPTAKPTAVPTVKPTTAPTVKPTVKPTAAPTVKPTAKPTAAPTAKPTTAPTAKPTAAPTAKPTAEPTEKPTTVPTVKPTTVPTVKPTTVPTVKPTAAPSPTPAPVYQSVTITKVDNITRARVTGAVLAVYDGSTYIDGWTTSAGQDHIVSGLTPDKVYRLTEVTAPGGYQKASDVYFKVNEKGQAYAGSFGNSLAATGNSAVTMMDVKEITTGEVAVHVQVDGVTGDNYKYSIGLNSSIAGMNSLGLSQFTANGNTYTYTANEVEKGTYTLSLYNWYSQNGYTSQAEIKIGDGQKKTLAYQSNVSVTVEAENTADIYITITYTAVATPTPTPTAVPTVKPTVKPTAKPTAVPTVKPTAKPTAVPTVKPTAVPTVKPTAKPTAVPTVKPTAVPTVKPTAVPTVKPTAVPTVKPTVKPTAKPTAVPTVKPTAKPTAVPTVKPTVKPTAVPTVKPTAKPTAVPTVKPTVKPTPTPTPTKTPLQKVTLGIRDENGNRVKGANLYLTENLDDIYDEDVVLDRWISAGDSDHVYEELTAGKTYCMVLSAVPTGYDFDDVSDYYFKVNADGKLYVGEDETSLSYQADGKVLTHVTSNGESPDAIYSKQEIPGAGGDDTLTVGAMAVTLGEDTDTVTERLGQPIRIDTNQLGVTVYIYNPGPDADSDADYTNYLAVGFLNDEVVQMFTVSRYFSYEDIVDGNSTSDVLLAGDWNKASSSYYPVNAYDDESSAKGRAGACTYSGDQETVVALTDCWGSGQVYGLLVYDGSFTQRQMCEVKYGSYGNNVLTSFRNEIYDMSTAFRVMNGVTSGRPILASDAKGNQIANSFCYDVLEGGDADLNAASAYFRGKDNTPTMIVGNPTEGSADAFAAIQYWVSYDFCRNAMLSGNRWSNPGMKCPFSKTGVGAYYSEDEGKLVMVQYYYY